MGEYELSARAILILVRCIHENGGLSGNNGGPPSLSEAMDSRCGS